MSSGYFSLVFHLKFISQNNGVGEKRRKTGGRHIYLNESTGSDRDIFFLIGKCVGNGRINNLYFRYFRNCVVCKWDEQ